jgi:ABC-type amino acid transport substrate-binding protein
VDESRLRRTLDKVDQFGEPDPTFLEGLYDQAVAEIGFDHPAHPAARRVGGGRPRLRVRRDGRSRWPLLLVAALVAAAALGALAVGALRNRAPTEPPDLLAQINGAGKIVIAIRPDHPQFAMAGQVATGFDVDVGQELARRLGVSPDVVVEPAAAMLSGADTNGWQIALPSVASWTIPAPGFAASGPYYLWPHFVVVAEASPATTVSQLGAGAICAVTGDGGEAWLRGRYVGAAAPSARLSIVTRSSDDDCLAMLTSGGAVAAVTADLTSGDLQARGGLRAIGGPDPEPRVVVVRTGDAQRADTASLLAAIDQAIESMRRDGSLTRLSENRFGVDLTNP